MPLIHLRNNNQLLNHIGFEKSYGIKNSNLNKIHCVGDPRVKVLCLQIEYFSKSYQRNGTEQQFISSYYFVILMLRIKSLVRRESKYFGWFNVIFNYVQTIPNSKVEKSTYDRNIKRGEYKAGDLVLLNIPKVKRDSLKKLDPKSEGPFIISQKLEPPK
ncbi:hypothetical protein BpHYR1_026310 [Brachionus plicatilis]|uniref:Uncharacterized protein n=1 Tax=Brachionus plicatilis TaxID=10195 RepID=A0A3M7RNC5_BRAPC|nr:hypothetical protein BpHYR1_026310 [Brachionus plicatilis]